MYEDFPMTCLWSLVDLSNDLSSCKMKDVASATPSSRLASEDCYTLLQSIPNWPQQTFFLKKIVWKHTGMERAGRMHEGVKRQQQHDLYHMTQPTRNTPHLPYEKSTQHFIIFVKELFKSTWKGLRHTYQQKVHGACTKIHRHKHTHQEMHNTWK